MNKTQVQKRARTIESRTVKIIAPDGAAIDVDAFMKPVLLHLWSRGIVTLDCCAGHFPDYDAYIRIERNADFEEYAMRGQWTSKIAPIMEIDPEKYNEIPPYTEGEKCVCLPKNIFIDTGKTAFLVYACHDLWGQSRIVRGRFLHWLLEF